MLSKCMHGSPCIMHYALCMAVHASITLISQHGLSSHYYCMCYYVISVMHYISNASAIHHSSAGYARQYAGGERAHHNDVARGHNHLTEHMCCTRSSSLSHHTMGVTKPCGNTYYLK
eukprot:jgi/Chrzof1/11514/UNPLg00448.t1